VQQPTISEEQSTVTGQIAIQTTVRATITESIVSIREALASRSEQVVPERMYLAPIRAQHALESELLTSTSEVRSRHQPVEPSNRVRVSPMSGDLNPDRAFRICRGPPVFFPDASTSASGVQ
jgi:hypothetical protein